MSKKQFTKTEYLQQLEKHLQKLPKEDFEDAMEYFTEYFEDADDEGTQALMEELGTPKEAARDLMTNLLNRKLTDASSGTETSGNTSHDAVNHSGTGRTTGHKIWKSILWISLLVLFAIPIGAPLLVSAVVVLLCIMICAVIMDLCVFIAAFSGFVIGGKLLLRGLLALPISLSGSAMIAGSGLMVIELGILVTLLGIFLTRQGCQFFVASVKRIANHRKKSKRGEAL